MTKDPKANFLRGNKVYKEYSSKNGYTGNDVMCTETASIVPSNQKLRHFDKADVILHTLSRDQACFCNKGLSLQNKIPC